LFYFYLFVYLFESGSTAHKTHKTADTHNKNKTRQKDKTENCINIRKL